MLILVSECNVRNMESPYSSKLKDKQYEPITAYQKITKFLLTLG